MSNLQNIWKNSGEPTDEQLMKYLNGTLTEEERYALEKQMADSDFTNDALEGLENFNDRQKLAIYVQELNKQLAKNTAAKKKRKNKRKLKQQDWVFISVIIVLLLCILGYLGVREYNKLKQHPIEIKN